MMKNQNEADGGELRFDECQILEPKVYSLKKTLITGQEVTIVKCKGVQKAGKKYDLHTRLLNGEVISTDVTMFIAGKECYMKDQDI